MDNRNKVVYIHLRKKDNQVFYVGMGSIKRPYDFKHRSTMWKKYVKAYGEPNVKIVKGYLTKKQAEELETKLIYKYGLRLYNKGTLINGNYGEHKKKSNNFPSYETFLRYSRKFK